MRQVWSCPLPEPATGLSQAREAGTLLLVDRAHHLSRHDRRGQVELRSRAPGTVAAAVISEDGRTIAAIGRRGQVWFMTQDLVVLWERTLSHRPVALALDVLGMRLAVADVSGGVTVFDRSGADCWRQSLPVPLVHLAFVAEEPLLIGSAQYGLVGAFDAAGNVVWRDGLVAHVGGVALSGDGSRIVLACFTDGLYCYEAGTGKRSQIARAAPSRLVALDYRGEILVTAGLSHELARRTPLGEVRSVLLFEAIITAVAVGPLGEDAFVLLNDGTLVGIELIPEAAE